MLSKRVIMHEWREFLRKRDSMTDGYPGLADGNPDAPPRPEAPLNPEAPPNSPGTHTPPLPGTPARAPAALDLVI